MCSSVPAYPFTSVPMSQESPPNPVSLATLFPCAKCTQTFEFSEPSQVTETQSEMEKEMEMEHEERRCVGKRVNCDSNYQLNSQCVLPVPLSLSLSGSNLPCSHNLVALSSLTLLCSAHYQAALCCPIARVWARTDRKREKGMERETAAHTQTFIWFIILPNN